MSSRVCVDACLVLKLVLYEPDSAESAALWESWLASGETIVAPPLLGCETTSVVRSRVYRGVLNPEAGEAAFDLLEDLFTAVIEFCSPPHLHRRAWELARDCDLPTAYDAYYAALAELERCALWTADRRLHERVRGHGIEIHLLGEAD